MKKNLLFGKYSNQWHTLVDAIAKEDTTGDTESENIQSIVCMVYTLVLEGKTSELNESLQKSFPEYYLQNAG